MDFKKNKKEFTVICHYPTDDKIEEFLDIFHKAVAIALINTHDEEWIEAFKRELKRQIEQDKNKK